MIYKEQKGAYGGTEYSLSDREDVLEEVRNEISGVTNPERAKIHYGNIKKIDLDSLKVNLAISNARKSKELQESVRTGIEGLLKHIE